MNSRATARKTILLTGGAGVVGQALLQRLLAHNVICLVHKTLIKAPGVTNLVGDISQPQLGISPAHFDWIAQRIDCIIHAAAITDFNQPSRIINQVNVDGLRNMLALAAIAKVPIYSISTAFINACQCPEGESPYTISKRQGEQMVRQSGLKYTIIRPSIVIGDAKTGEIARFQGFYTVIGSWLRGLLPLVPMLPQAYIDFVPQDTVADAIATLVEGNNTGEFWLTSGAQAFTVERIAEIVVKFAHRQGLSVEPPHFVAPNLETLHHDDVAFPSSKSARKRINWFKHVSPYLSNTVPFPSSLPELTPLPCLEAALMQSLDYWAKNLGKLKGK